MNFESIYIDIREEHELLEKYIMAVNDKIYVVSIPMRILFANLQWINQQQVPIIIICRTGHRARQVKDQYFKDNTNITILEEGINSIKENSIDGIKIVYGKGGYGQQQYLQIMFASILTIVLLLIVSNFQYTKYIIIGFISMILYQVLNEKCYLAKILPFPQFINSNL
jgi:rhodanese-related sulfurtransferase